MTVTVALLALPSPAAAQRDPFFSAVVAFYRLLPGLYGDEGPQLTAQWQLMSAALDRWDQDILDAERELRARVQSDGDLQTRLQVHTILASLYVERGRLADAVREFDEDIRLDPRRAAFHRLKGLVLQAAARDAEAADAFHAAWLLEPDDPQNAYRLIADRSAGPAPRDLERARETLANVEGALVRGETAGAPALFTNVRAIVDDAGGGMAFVPAAYASGFSFILRGDLHRGVAELGAALAQDPLVTDPALRSEPMVRGIAALREAVSAAAASATPVAEDLVASATGHLETAVAAATGSPEAHRILASAYSIGGDIASSLEHLREAVRLGPRDERVHLALTQVLASAGRSADHQEALRAAVATLPESGALRWRLSTQSQARQDDADRALIAMADRLVLLVGRGELYRALAGLAQLHRDEAQAIAFLQRAVRLTPNSTAAHKALGRAYAENGRHTEAYAEHVIALRLDPDDVETLTALGRWHLAADQPGQAVDVLQRAVNLDPTDRLAVHALAGALVRAGRVREGGERLQESERLQARAIEDERRAKAAAVLRLDAEMRLDGRDYAAAVDLWRQALQMQPGAAAVHLRIASALAAAGRVDEAVAEFVTAISLDAGSDAHRQLADLYRSAGRTGDAARARSLYIRRRLDELRQRAERGAFGW